MLCNKEQKYFPPKIISPPKRLKTWLQACRTVKAAAACRVATVSFSLSLYITLGDKPDGALPEADKAGIRTAVCHTWQGMLLFCYPYRRVAYISVCFAM